jgi:hypothetical protein
VHDESGRGEDSCVDLNRTGTPLLESSSPGELHPQALTEPDVNLSAHPALIVQSQDEFRVTTSQTGLVLAEQHGPASELPYVDGYAEV